VLGTVENGGNVALQNDDVGVKVTVDGTVAVVLGMTTIGERSATGAIL
jgi:hypothetical protein